MLSPVRLYIVAALLALSSPFPIQSAHPYLTIPLIPKPAHTLPSGLTSIVRTYAKYHIPLPPSLQLATTSGPGSSPVTPEPYDSEYLVPVKIGSPAATYNLDLDTGSSQLEINFKTTKTVPSTVTVGATVVTNQPVLYTPTAGSFQPADPDGLLGLAPVAGTFYFNAVAQGLSPALFTVNLKRGAVGTLSFGAIDRTAYTGTLTFVNVNTANGFWQFSASGYAVGSAAFVTLAIDSVVDTGTTLLYLPQAAVTAYYAQVSGAANSATYGGYVFPCSAALPSLTVGIGAYKAVVPGSYLNYAPVGDGSTTCFGGIQSNTGIGFSILGDVFLKSQFVVFQGTKAPTLGFAAKPL